MTSRRRNVLESLREFVVDESGQSTTEYVLIIAMITIPIYAALKEMMKKLIGNFMATLIQKFTIG